MNADERNFWRFGGGALFVMVEATFYVDVLLTTLRDASHDFIEVWIDIGDVVLGGIMVAPAAAIGFLTWRSMRRRAR